MNVKITDKIFLESSKKFVAEVLIIDTNKTILPDDIYTVWFSKTLQNFKGLFSTDEVQGFYVEVTYNGDKDEFYVDNYKKESNKLFKLNTDHVKSI